MKKQLLLLTLPLLLVGCNKEETPIPTLEVTHDLSYKYEDLASDPNYEEVTESCNLGGWFLEVNTNRCLATNSRYDFIFVASGTTSSNFTVKLSNTEHATVEMGTDNRTFYLNTLTAGDTILSVYNANDLLCYRHVVRVRPALTETNILKTVADADHFSTIPEAAIYTGEWKYTALDEDGSSVLYGKDEMETSGLTVTFDLTYKEYISNTELYVFTCKNEKDYSANTYITHVAFSKVCDLAYIYYASSIGSTDTHILTITYNSDCEYIYKSSSK